MGLEGADSNDGAASTEEIVHWGDQEKEASKERLTPKYFLEKASEEARIWTWFGGVAGPAWLILIIFLMAWAYLLI